jgi:hypothetical protein
MDNFSTCLWNFIIVNQLVNYAKTTSLSSIQLKRTRELKNKFLYILKKKLLSIISNFLN